MSNQGEEVESVEDTPSIMQEEVVGELVGKNMGDIDNPPKPRNEKLASLMRNLKICEELGSGWDRIVLNCELELLPAPQMKLYPESTKVTMYAKCNFTEMSMDDKVWSCYLHACVKQVNGESITNASLRERFGVEQNSSASISRLIKESIDRGLIRPLDASTAPRHMYQLPKILTLNKNKTK